MLNRFSCFRLAQVKRSDKQLVRLREPDTPALLVGNETPSHKGSKFVLILWPSIPINAFRNLLWGYASSSLKMWMHKVTHCSSVCIWKFQNSHNLNAHPQETVWINCGTATPAVETSQPWTCTSCHLAKLSSFCWISSSLNRMAGNEGPWLPPQHWTYSNIIVRLAYLRNVYDINKK